MINRVMKDVKIGVEEDIVSYQFNTLGCKTNTLDCIDDLIYSLNDLRKHVTKKYTYTDTMPDLKVITRYYTTEVKELINDYP